MNREIVILKNVTKEYQERSNIIKVVKEANLSIPDSGKMVAIIGLSGSGKSTLLNLMGTLDKPGEGTILDRLST